MATLLVVDDEFGIVEVISAALEEEGHRVLSAVNGRQGLQRLGEAPVDLVLLDFMMPIMDGPSMFRAMQAEAAFRGIPVLFMTSLDEARVRQECGPDVGYLRKPFSVSRLFRLVDRMLAERRGEGPASGGT